MSLLTNLAVFWNCDDSSGDLTDSSGNGFTMTNNNSATYVAGLIGNAMNLSRASNQYFSKSATTVVGSGGDMTVQAWINLASSPSNANPQTLILQGYNGNTARAFVIYLETDINISISDTGSGGFTGTIAWSPSTSTWYQFIFTFTSASHTGEVFINNSSIGTTDLSSTAMFTGNGLLAIGDDTASSDNFNGKMDMVGVWNRVLTAPERATLYNSGAGLQYPFTSGPANIKTWDGVASANIKTIDGVDWNNVQ